MLISLSMDEKHILISADFMRLELELVQGLKDGSKILVPVAGSGLINTVALEIVDVDKPIEYKLDETAISSELVSQFNEEKYNGMEETQQPEEGEEDEDENNSDEEGTESEEESEDREENESEDGELVTAGPTPRKRGRPAKPDNRGHVDPVPYVSYKE